MSIQDHHRGSASISLSPDMGLDMPSLELPMSSNENPPQLALSDIMHHMSPSPVPAEDSRTADYLEMGGPYPNGNRRERGGSPEPLTEADVVAMRRRLHDLGISLDSDQNELNIGEGLSRHSDNFGDTNLRERELVNMVLRLTDPLPADSTQLERQADMISTLTLQRDFLMRQAEEDRDRWRSEREGWDRMAEALLSHRNRIGKSGTREDETERQKVQLESENRALRVKLQDTQNRLSSLESELMRLKPLLLMQPYSVAHLRQNLTSQPQASSQPPNTPLTTGHGPPDVRPNKITSDAKGKRREADPASSQAQLEAIPEDTGMNEEQSSGPTSLARSSHPGSLPPSANMPLPASNSTTDTYRRPEPLSQYTYPYNYHYSTPSASPSKSLIPPKITVNSPSSSSTSHSQLQLHTASGSTPKSLGITGLPTTPSQSHTLPQASRTASPQRRRSRVHTNQPAGTAHGPIRRSKHGIVPLTSDARTEHVLLAARRIGRERAGLVAGIKQHAERENEIHSRDLELIKARQDLEKSEKERLERLANGTSGLAYYRSTDVLTSPQQRITGGTTPTSMPKTPKRVGASHYPSLSGALSNSPISTPTRVPTSAGPSTFVFVNSSAGAGTSGYSGSGIMSTPGQLGSAVKSGGIARGGSRTLPSNPPTPLDSLLDAARSMMDDGVGAKAGGKINGTRKALEHPESPVPKRRRVSSVGSKMVGRGGGVAGAGKVTRVRSALDVLADQAAAAFDEPGQTRGSTAGGKGKEKMKFSDEDLGSGDDCETDNGQEGDDVGRQDDSLPRGSASALFVGPSRGRSRAKTASTSTRPTAEPLSTSSMSLRPIRQASQKRLASQDLQQQPSTSTTAIRGKGKSRGRPKGSKSRTLSAVFAKSSSTLKNPSLGPRIIASAPKYSSLDEAIALQSQTDRGRETGQEQERREDSQRTAINLDRSTDIGSHELGLRPVVEWGGDAEEDEGDEDVEGEGEYVSSVATGGRELGLAQQDGYVEGRPDAGGDGEIAADNDKVTATTTPNEESVSTLKSIAQDMEEDETQMINTTNGHISPAGMDLMTIPPVNDTDADAEADLDDEDAEGDQEDDDDDDQNDGAEAGHDRSSRSRTPPPPDPPHFGAPSDSNDDDPDADADAEGEMDFEENEELPPTSTSSAVHQTALSVPRSQVPPGFLGATRLPVDVLISATIAENLPSSLTEICCRFAGRIVGKYRKKAKGIIPNHHVVEPHLGVFAEPQGSSRLFIKHDEDSDIGPWPFRICRFPVRSN